MYGIHRGYGLVELEGLAVHRAVEGEAVFVVNDVRLADVDKPDFGRIIIFHANVVLETVIACDDFFSHLFPFPIIPIGDMRESLVGVDAL